MEDYESQYEEYKNTLLHEKWFRNKLTDLYRGSLNVDEDYISQNGVLWKVGVLSGACGICFSLFSSLDGRSDAKSIIIRIVLAAIMIACFVFAMHIGKKFVKTSGERKFYAFQYDQYFKDYIQEEKRKEMYEFEKDLSKTVCFIQRCSTNPSNNPSEVIEEFRRASRYVEELEKQYKHISRYDNFAWRLKNDWYFNAEIQKDIDRYI